MLTHLSLPEKQYNNTSQEYVGDTSALTYYDVRLVLDVTSVNAGSSLTGYLQAEKDGQVLIRTNVYIDAIGQYQFGCSKAGETGVIYRGSFTVDGRMRLSARVVSFNHFEDVPEVI